MSSVYLDTSLISACVSNRMDAVHIVRRETSLDWWHSQRSQHEVFISAEVIAELSSPLFPLRDVALDWVRDLPLVAINDAVRGLATVLVEETVMPGPVAGDAIHVAAATVHRIENLLSWNVRHLANPNKLRHLQVICTRAGHVPPRIVTPDFLWET